MRVVRIGLWWLLGLGSAVALGYFVFWPREESAAEMRRADMLIAVRELGARAAVSTSH